MKKVYKYPTGAVISDSYENREQKLKQSLIKKIEKYRRKGFDFGNAVELRNCTIDDIIKILNNA